MKKVSKKFVIISLAVIIICSTIVGGVFAVKTNQYKNTLLEKKEAILEINEGIDDSLDKISTVKRFNTSAEIFTDLSTNTFEIKELQENFTQVSAELNKGSVFVLGYDSEFIEYKDNLNNTVKSLEDFYEYYKAIAQIDADFEIIYEKGSTLSSASALTTFESLKSDCLALKELINTEKKGKLAGQKKTLKIYLEYVNNILGSIDPMIEDVKEISRIKSEIGKRYGSIISYYEIRSLIAAQHNATQGVRQRLIDKIVIWKPTIPDFVQQLKNDYRANFKSMVGNYNLDFEVI